VVVGHRHRVTEPDLLKFVRLRLGGVAGIDVRAQYRLELLGTEVGGLDEHRDVEAIVPVLVRLYNAGELPG
jgi:hypothetical protein